MGIVNSSGTVTNCTVYFNSANEDGGGIFITGVETNASVINCTVYCNLAKGDGAGIYNYQGEITNCIVWNNKNSGDIYNDDSNSTVSNSCYWGTTGTNGNIKSDPLFVNTSGDISTWDFHLQTGSPCIDAGKYIPGLATDFENNPRPINGVADPRGDGSDYDMGAYEYVPLIDQNANLFVLY